MSNQNRRRLLRPSLVPGAVVLALVASPAWAQTTAPPTVLPDPATVVQQQAQAPAGPVLELSMDEAVNLAMQHNLGLQSARLNLDVASTNIAATRAAFLPSLTTSLSRNTSQAQGFRNADGTTSVTSATRLDGGSRMNGVLPWYGTAYTVNWNAARRETPGASASFNPSLNSSFSFNLNQPLWGGLLIDSQRFNLESNQRGQVIADLNVRQAQVQLEAGVRSAYLTLVAAREQFAVTQQNLELAEQSLRNSRARVEVGVAPQTDVIGDEAAVASSRVQVIQAEAAIDQAEDNLRAIVLDPNRPDYWEVNLVPTDQILLAEREIDLEAVIANAMANRIDRQITVRDMELEDLGLRVAKDNTRPTLDFGLTYNAGAFGGRSVELGDISFGSVLGDTFGGRYPSWTTGLSFSYPIGRTSAEAAFARAQIQRRQSDIALRELDLQIVREVRDAVRQVENAFRQVEAARVALQASELNLEAEQRKLEVGLSRSLDVQLLQQRLADARIRELNAIIGYNRALINLDRIQIVR